MDKNLPFKKRIFLREDSYNTELTNSPEALHHDLENTAEPSTSNETQQMGYLSSSSYSDLTDSADEMEDEPALDMTYKRKVNRLKNLQAEDDFIQIENAFRGNLKTFYYKNHNKNIKDICLLLIHIKTKLENILNTLLTEFGPIKFNMVVECTYIKHVINEKQDRAFKTKNTELFLESDVSKILDNSIKNICYEEQTYESHKSGWALHNVDGILLRINKYRPLKGSSYIALPNFLISRNCIINPKNLNDEKCFKWAILCRYVSGLHVERINYRYNDLETKFNFSKISFPTPIKEIRIFEKNNNVSINVYAIDEEKNIYPIKVCDKEKNNHFDLLLLYDGNTGKQHYCYIKNFNILVRKQLTKHHGKIEICKRCFMHFYNISKLKSHKKYCGKFQPTRVVMPEDTVLKFKNYQFSFRIPIVAYADFECILKPISGCFPKSTKSFTVANELHIPMSFCIYFLIDEEIPYSIRCQLPKVPYIYRGKNAAKEFMMYLVKVVNTIGKLTKEINPLKMTDRDKYKFRTTTHCEMCKDEFTMIKKPVRDHCHLSGRYRAALCNNCNLKRRKQCFIPVFIHGNSNYDSHFIIRQLGYDSKQIYVIPNSSEKYISFSKKTQSGIIIRFVDTYRFLNFSLADLCSFLPEDCFIHSKKFFSLNDINLVTKKGVYPYEYTDSWKKLEEKQLPPKKEFFSKLNNDDISDEKYQHAVEVWNHFQINTLGEYSDLYLKTDVLILCDVFENFRKLCLSIYNLDCAHYLTAPGFAFDAMLSYTKIELELLSDYDKYLMIEKGIRGGISLCIKRHAVANNKYIDNTYNINLPNTYLAYLDANNLYGWAMSKYIPYGGFTWCTTDIDILNIPDDSPVGFILEVDVEYPQFLHDNHSDLPFLPVNKCTNKSKQSKLLTTLELKENYICHYVNLKQAVNHGLVIKKIHRVLQFFQSQWLKSYIDLNTEKRQNAKNKFEIEFFKLLNNSVFGKCMENLRKRSNLELVSNVKRLQKLIAQPVFKDRIIYDKTLCAVLLNNKSICFNKPIYVGFTVLELSKTLMYSFHYDVMKRKYQNNIALLYTDTDSLFYEIKTNDFYHDMLSEELIDYFDTSDYPKDHFCYSLKNKKVLGKFKDECSGLPIIEFVGLRPKLYSFRIKKEKKNIIKKAKGIKKNIIEKNIKFEDYKLSLFLPGNSGNMYRLMRLFQSKKHEIKTISCNKLALNNADDKRVICNDKINTLPYGHYKLLESNEIKL